MPTDATPTPANGKAAGETAAGGLLSVEDAVQRGLRLVTPVGETEQVALGDAAGRISAAPVHATMALPPFNNSAMDGYSLNTASLAGEPPYTVRVTARVAAGDSGQLSATPQHAGGAVRIFTGAPIPDGYDAVIMQEQCRVNGGEITFSKCPVAGQNVRRQGEDCPAGSVVLDAGVELDARHIALVSALGLPTIEVTRKVRVGFFSTGSELRRPGQSLAPGQIYNSNRYMLAADLTRPAIELDDLGAVRDDPKLLREVLEQAAAANDFVITTGGVSVGDEDHMPGLIREVGGEIHVSKVAIKPGKPVTIATIGKTIYIGLPGNPVAAYVIYLVIGRQIIRRSSGAAAGAAAPIRARVAFERQRRPGREEYLPARIIGMSDDGLPLVEAFAKAGSANLVSLAGADGFAILPTRLTSLTKGDAVDFLRLA